LGRVGGSNEKKRGACAKYHDIAAENHERDAPFRTSRRLELAQKTVGTFNSYFLPPRKAWNLEISFQPDLRRNGISVGANNTDVGVKKHDQFDGALFLNGSSACYIQLDFSPG
jgi:hypothetical protein